MSMIQMQDRSAELKIRQQDESSDDQQSDDLSLSIHLLPSPASVCFFFQYFCFHFVQFFCCQCVSTLHFNNTDYL